MLPRFCRCAFLITGGFLLLLALVLALRIDLDAAPMPTHQIERARVAQAVSQLESGCLTCHELVNTAPPIAEAELAVLINLNPTPYNQPTVFPSLQEQLQTQLITTGHRIVNVPQVRDHRFETVVEDYLHVYAQVSTGDPVSEQRAQWAFEQLDRMVYVLGALENQAAPIRLTRSENQPVPSAAAVLYTLTSAPMVAAIVQSVSVGDRVQFTAARLDVTRFAMPQEIVYATHRRGPPAGVVLDSVVQRRLPSFWDAQSLFIFLVTLRDVPQQT